MYTVYSMNKVHFIVFIYKYEFHSFFNGFPVLVTKSPVSKAIVEQPPCGFEILVQSIKDQTVAVYLQVLVTGIVPIHIITLAEFPGRFLGCQHELETVFCFF